MNDSHGIPVRCYADVCRAPSLSRFLPIFNAPPPSFPAPPFFRPSLPEDDDDAAPIGYLIAPPPFTVISMGDDGRVERLLDNNNFDYSRVDS